MLASYPCNHTIQIRCVIIRYRTVKNFGGQKVWRKELLQGIGGKNFGEKARVVSCNQLEISATLPFRQVFLHQIVNSTTQTDVIYLDIQKAFDSIPHCKLLAKLWSFEITGNLWRWIQCYLSGRTQVVRINNILSTTLPVLSGVPQGSILGPVLFLIYMNDLPSVTTMSKSLLFVDDTKCFNNVSNTMDSVSLQQDLDFIARWSIQSSLKFNTTKSVHLSFKSKVTGYHIQVIGCSSCHKYYT